MNISVVGCAGVPARYGGFETLADYLICDDLKGMTIYCSAKHCAERRQHYKGVQLRYMPLDANGMQSIFYDIMSMVDAVFRKSDIILVLGVSGAIALPIVRLISRAKIVTNIDGVEWKRAKWGEFARCFLKFSESLAVRFSHAVIADNQIIHDYVDKAYAKKAWMIPYGGDHVITGQASSKKGDYAFALCRIEPENNIHLILEALSVCAGQKLKFVGNWEKSDYGRGLKAKYSDCVNIELLDPIYDLDILEELRVGCEFYIHGHSAGGTNPSLVEMMFFEKPIICFDCDYNRSTTNGKALYFRDQKELVDLINSGEHESVIIGKDMREIAMRSYTWSIVRQQYNQLFKELVL